MKYIVFGSTIINDLYFADGSSRKGILGGSIYALAGIRPYEEQVVLITKAGHDFEQYFGGYFDANHLLRDGVNFGLPHSFYTKLVYQPDGRWSESSIYPNDPLNFFDPQYQVSYDMVLPFCEAGSRGIYSESSYTDPFWNHLQEIREAAPDVKIMWELFTQEANDPSCRSSLLDLMTKVDIYSLNLPESLAFFSVTNESEAINKIKALEKPCFYRVGEKGAYFIQNGQAWFAPSYGVETSVDPTGCGNCSTAAALYGFAEGFHPLKTALAAGLAAGLNAQQFGPFPKFTADIKQDLLDQVEREFERLKEVSCF